jgi:outer membrane protein OmpA-like peptidoglycan-associated protein
MTRTVPLAALLVFTALGGAIPLAAYGQSNPSSDQIINSLRPMVGSGSGTTRGLRPGAPLSAAPAAAAAPAPAPAASAPSAAAPGTAPRAAAIRPASRPAPAPTAEASDEKPSVNLTVQFRTGSADLTSEAIHTLDELGKALSSSQLAAFHFRIEGHTDTVGSRDANMQLSERRADAVVEYLATHFNIDRSRLQPVGMGENGLLVSTGDQVPEARNRRVLVVNLGA